MAKTPEYYRRLAYTRRVRLAQDERGPHFVAFIDELPGVEAGGATDVEARAALAHAFEDYIEAMLAWGEEIPEPTPWPQSAGLHPSADFATAPVTIVSMSGVVIGALESPPSVDVLEKYRAVEELGREMETSAA